MASTVDPNEQNFINTNLDAVTSNAADNPQLVRSTSGAGVARKGYYVTRTALNATTGQTDSDTALVT